MAHILVVEDDEEIGGLLDAGLRANGYEVTRAATASEALAHAAHLEGALDLILLDVGLPDVDGIEVCRDLRLRQPAAVIVMLTARSQEMDVVAGLESGADDYLVKPFRMVELLARLRAHLRRGGPQDRPSEAGLVDLGALRIDLRSRSCTLGGAHIPLRTKEFDLLFRLARSAGSALSRETLMADVWDENWWGSTKTLDVHIAAVRRRLSDAARSVGVEEPTITTLRGHGYRMELTSA